MTADQRSSLVETASAFTKALRLTVPDVGELVWNDEMFDGELFAIVADVLPSEPGPTGPEVSVYENDELGVSIGPTEFRFLSHDSRGIAGAVDLLEAFLKGGALVEARKRFGRVRTEVTVPMNGKPNWSLHQDVAPEGFGLGTHAIPPPTVVVLGIDGSPLRRTLGEVAIGTASSGPLEGARVSVVDFRGWTFEWDGPERDRFTDSYYDSSVDAVLAFSVYSEEVDWSWLDPRFTAWLDRGTAWISHGGSDSGDLEQAVDTWFVRLERHVADASGVSGRRLGTSPLTDGGLVWEMRSDAQLRIGVGSDLTRERGKATLDITCDGDPCGFLLIEFGEVTAVMFDGVGADPWDSALNGWIVDKLASDDA